MIALSVFDQQQQLLFSADLQYHTVIQIRDPYCFTQLVKLSVFLCLYYSVQYICLFPLFTMEQSPHGNKDTFYSTYI